MPICRNPVCPPRRFLPKSNVEETDNPCGGLENRPFSSILAPFFEAKELQ